jgi:hypothetical protein
MEIQNTIALSSFHIHIKRNLLLVPLICFILIQYPKISHEYLFMYALLFYDLVYLSLAGE